MRTSYLFFIFFIPLFFACIDENNDVPDNTDAPYEGSLSIGFNGQFYKGKDTLEIIMDTLDNTRISYFQIRNDGLEDIKNLKISISDSFCKVSPLLVSTLKGVRDMNNVEQKISLTINHGKLYSNGQISLPVYMKRGWNHLMLSFEGYSKAQNVDSLPVKMNVWLSFFARYADFEILQEDTLLDLNKSTEKVATGLDNAGPIYTFNYRNASSYKIKNTGNTVLIYTIASAYKIFKELESDTLFPLEVKNISLPQKSDTSKVFIKVNSNNIVQNIEKKLAYKNGSSYILLINTK